MFSGKASVVYFPCLYQLCIRWDPSSVFLFCPIWPIALWLEGSLSKVIGIYLPPGALCYLCVCEIMCNTIIQCITESIHTYILPYTRLKKGCFLWQLL